MTKFDAEAHPLGTEPPEADVRVQLQRILASPEFSATQRRREFFAYVVEETLAGRSGRLKGSVIAVTVFGREPDFDPQNDPVVRLEAHRLRRDLDGYYATSGRDDPVRIGIPKGAYAAVFGWQRTTELTTEPGLAATEPSFPAPSAAMSVSEPQLLPDARAVSPRRLLLAACGMVAIGLIGVLAWSVLGLGDAGRSPPKVTVDRTASALRGPSIAVLPFRNLSGDMSQKHVSDGLTEQLVTELARYRDLFVMSLGTTAIHGRDPVDPREIRSDLGVDYVLDGGVRIFADQLRISSHLIDAETGRHLWVGSFSDVFMPKTVFQIQDTISREVAAALAGKYGVLARSAMARAERKPPDSLDAYDCVLQYYSFMKQFDPVRHASVRDCLERAVALEPDYSEAWAVLANVYHQEMRFGFPSGDGHDDPREKAFAAAKQAIALDPENPTGHLVHALVHFAEGHIDRFKEAGARAIALNPGNADFLAQYGTRLSFIGEWESGLAMVDRAVALNPAHPPWYLFPRAFYDYSRGEYAAALAQAERIDMPRFFWSHLLKAMIFGKLGRRTEADAAVGEALALNPDFAEHAWPLLRVWQFPEPLLQQLADGLRKAGIDIPPPPRS